MGVLVEICCGSVEDVLAAEKGGANRVELCSALPLGGLTPSAGTLTGCKSLSTLPLMVMIRPRSGGFCYSEIEFDTMLRDAELALSLGADGLVFGFLNADGALNYARTRQMADLCGERTAVFHRAFDVVPNPLATLEELIDIGIDRVLTSGQRRSSADGASLIRQLVGIAKGRIEVLPGGGVRKHNLAEIVAQTGCDQVHMTAHASAVDSSTHANREISFGASSLPSEDQVDIVDSATVAAIVAEAATA